MKTIKTDFENSPWNRVTSEKDIDLLIVSSGVSRRYSYDAIQLLGAKNIGLLNLVTSYPLPKKTVLDTLAKAKRVLFAEEVDPFIEDEVRSLAVDLDVIPEFHGKRDVTIPSYGEMTADIMRTAIAKLKDIPLETIKTTASDILVPRPLTFCAGCTHRNFYWAVRKVRKRLKNKLTVAGDIGCYSLGVFYDRAMTTMQAMGSGIGVAAGLGQLERFGFDSKVLAVAGDSTFFHACIPGLINAKHKNANLTFVVLDNATTAMTGFQPHPGSMQENNKLRRVSIEALIKALEPDFFARSDTENIPHLIDLIHSTVQKDGLKVLLLDSVCRLEEARRETSTESIVYRINQDKCRGEKCLICVQDFACPAINWSNEIAHPEILEQLCVQCGACVAVCPHDAIEEVDL
jgi:indolepyruvate ferredoxin oxidoreductase alpha subunit